MSELSGNYKHEFCILQIFSNLEVLDQNRLKLYTPVQFTFEF